MPTSVAGSSRPRVVHEWERVEVRLYASEEVPNPYLDVDVWVDLEGPGGTQRVRGVWDGGNAYCVRLLATEPGEWTWTSGSNRPDAGLNGHTGGFVAVPWTEEDKQANPCRRGMPRPTPNGHALEYADGTPCFLLGDTWWAASTYRFPWREGGEEVPLGPGMGFQDMVRYRRAQGYNCIAILAALPNWANDGHPARLETPDGTPLRDAWQQPGTASAKDMHNEGGCAFLFPGRVPGFEDVFPDVERINPRYFQHLDRKIDYLNAQGFIAFLEVARRDVSPAWQRFYPWPASYARYVEYVWARYQASICILSPIHFDWPARSIPSREFNAPADAVVARGVPAFGNLRSCNAAGSSLMNFGEPAWLTLHQIGNRRDHNSHWLLTQVYREAHPPRPALNGEPYYAGWPPGTEIAPDSPEADANCRSGMYGSFLSGGLAGHIYGAVGLWGGDVEPEAAYRTWEALAFRSGAQMQYLARFALSEGRRYQDLVPDADLVVPSRTAETTGNEGWNYCARTPERDLFMFYLEREPAGAARPVSVRGLRFGARYRATWFDPRTGAWSEAGVVEADSLCEARLPERPTAEDWALKLVLAP